ncbi:MAG: hypothetical protein ACYDIC_07545 [Desulfobaccales bacterium]
MGNLQVNPKAKVSDSLLSVPQLVICGFAWSNLAKGDPIYDESEAQDTFGG